MFAKFKSGGGATAAPVAPNALESNPIWNHYDVGKQIGTAGPENVWKILEGYRKGDGKEVSIFLFEKRSVEKLHKPKRKEAVAEMLRVGVRHLERFRHPKILQVLHSIEECPETLAFVSEPVLTGLANVHAAMEQKYLTEIASQNSNQQVNHQGSGHQHHQTNQQEHKKPIFPKYYDLLDIELKYGILQVTEALSFLHYSGQVMHRNVCPSNVLITKKGTWKLFGFEFIERVNENDALKPVSLPSWTTRIPKITQPNLDYLAPEVQYEKCGSILSDMYSLGMLICTIFNHGRPLVQANHSASEYHKQIETLEDGVSSILSRIPLPLQEAVTRLLNREQKSRPTAQLLSLIKYFSDPAVHALQFLDVINMKDPTQKSHFYRVTLKEALPYVPRKLWYQHVWPSLVQEASLQESFASVMQPMLYMIQSVTKDEYLKIIYPEFKQLFASPRSIQGSVVLLENLHIILQKTPDDDIGNVLSLFFNGLDCNTIQIQSASFIAVPNVQHYLGNDEVRTRVVPKLKAAFQQNTTDQRILMTALSCILDRLEKQQIIEHILPLLWAAKLDEIEILVRVIGVYRLMLSDKKYGLTINLMATRVMPSLLPQAVNPSLTLEHFTNLFDVLQEMLNHIERNQRNTLKLDNMTLLSPERHRPLRHQYSTDNMHVPPFNIPNLRIEQRKTSSAEDMARKNSIGSMSMTASAENMTRKNSMAGMLGSWWFGGSTSSANADSNFLRVANTFTSRRLSDNTLMTPKIRIAPSCASSPGGTPGGGLPIRRHSSTGPQERRGSNINLSPPTGGGMPITSSSVPYLLSSSLTSVRGSRRPSVSSTSSQQGAGLLQQFGSGMYQLFSGRSQ